MLSVHLTYTDQQQFTISSAPNGIKVFQLLYLSITGPKVLSLNKSKLCLHIVDGEFPLDRKIKIQRQDENNLLCEAPPD